jgi:hypothetical protein
MAGKAEDDLFKLAEEAGGSDSEAQDRFPDEGIFRPSREVKDAPGFETRVKDPTAKPSDKSEKPKTTRARMPRGSQTEKQAADIAETLEEKFSIIFGLVSGVAPVTGVYGTENSGKAVRALLDIGKRRPSVMKAITKIADGADGLELGKFLVGLVVALQVDMGRMDAGTLPARATGVTEIVEKYFMSPADAPENPMMPTQVVNSAAVFEPIS